MSEEDFRPEEEFGQGDADAELDQLAAGIRDAAPVLTMMHFSSTRCGLCREDAAEIAVRWWMASADQGRELREE